MEFENNLITNKHVLIHGNKNNLLDHQEFDFILSNFCGRVMDINNLEKINNDDLVFFCGDFSSFKNIERNIFVIENLTYNYIETTNVQLINSANVPINVYNVGLMFRNFFDPTINYFEKITKEHEFQTLTESNKISNAFRTGIYLTPIIEKNNVIEFNLLRCSSNLNGPTDNFRETDHIIVNKLNETIKYYFDKPVILNHILAQVYHNSSQNGVDKKAKIKDHSDKTKDMPREAVMAFCSFYQNYNSSFDPSVLTKLRFRLKPEVPHILKEKFDVILYPNSVFLMSLTTNRLYTHEIVPSSLPIDKIPTRMGYVVRCSNSKAIYKDDKTYLVKDNKLIELIEPTNENVSKLKNLYYKENMFCDVVYYDETNFSLNSGDYLKPNV